MSKKYRPYITGDRVLEKTGVHVPKQLSGHDLIALQSDMEDIQRIAAALQDGFSPQGDVDDLSEMQLNHRKEEWEHERAEQIRVIAGKWITKLE